MARPRHPLDVHRSAVPARILPLRLAGKRGVRCLLPVPDCRLHADASPRLCWPRGLGPPLAVAPVPARARGDTGQRSLRAVPRLSVDRRVPSCGGGGRGAPAPPRRPPPPPPCASPPCPPPAPRRPAPSR